MVRKSPRSRIFDSTILYIIIFLQYSLAAVQVQDTFYNFLCGLLYCLLKILDFHHHTTRNISRIGRHFDLPRVQICACHSIYNKLLSSKTDRTSLRDRVEPGMQHAARSLRFTYTEFYFSIKEIGSFGQFCQIIESDTAKEEKSYCHFLNCLSLSQ